MSVICPTTTWPTNTCKFWPNRYKLALQLYALDLSCNRIFAPTWREVLPLVKQLLTKATYVDLAGNYLPALLPDQLELQDMLKQNISLTAPNRYLGSTEWVRQRTSKAHEFRRIAYREEAEEDSNVE